MSFDMDMDNLFDIKSTPPSMSPNSMNPTWESRYEELLRWRSEKGDTCVPKAEGALGRWVARQRELKRTGKLGPEREDKLNAINFVWNTVTAMWEERFRRLKEWKKGHGHCAVPIAQGELGTWVSKQRQLRKRGKLSKEKVEALDSLQFTWSTAEADWEDKFKRLCEWTRERGHASVPFNEGELGWWVNTQRQCKRKGKLSAVREARLQSLGFVWNPSNSRTRTSSTATTTTATTATTTTTTTATTATATTATTATNDHQHLNLNLSLPHDNGHHRGFAGETTFTASSSTDTTPTWTPEKGIEKEFSEEETNNAILQLFGTHHEDCVVMEGSPVTATDLGIGLGGNNGGSNQNNQNINNQHNNCNGGVSISCGDGPTILKQEGLPLMVSTGTENFDTLNSTIMMSSVAGGGGGRERGSIIIGTGNATIGSSAAMTTNCGSIGISTVVEEGGAAAGPQQLQQQSQPQTQHQSHHLHPHPYQQQHPNLHHDVVPTESPRGGLLCDNLWSPTILSSPLMNGVHLSDIGSHVIDNGDVNGHGGSDMTMPPPLNFF